MEKNNFLNAISCIKNIDKTVDKLSEMGISVLDSSVYSSINMLVEIFFDEIYTKDGREWITWYLYELPNLGEGIHATDGNNNPIDFSNDEKLWEFVEREYGKH